MAYQDTPDASKGNAFCWNTWQPRINWRPSQQEACSSKVTKAVDAKRAAGIDPLFIGGMGSAARQHPLDPARFTLARISKEAYRG